MIDARGLSCPLPVFEVQKAVKAANPDTLEIVVDNQCAVENITRFGSNNGYLVEASNHEGDFLLTLTKRHG